MFLQDSGTLTIIKGPNEADFFKLLVPLFRNAIFVASNISRELNLKDRQFGQISNPLKTPTLNLDMIWKLEFQVPLDSSKA